MSEAYFTGDSIECKSIANGLLGSFLIKRAQLINLILRLCLS